jgi:hypothetical protein
LTEAQNLLPEDEHPLPWYPPVCVPLMEIPEGQKKTYDHIKSVSYDERTRIPLKLTDPSMFPVSILEECSTSTLRKNKLLYCVSKMQFFCTFYCTFNLKNSGSDGIL